MKGRIIKIIGPKFSVYDEKTNEIHIADAAGKLRFVEIEKDSKFNVNVTHKTKKENKVIKIIPKVGDFCNYEAYEEHYLITEILERNNEMVRPLISNVDQIILIFAAKEPDFSFFLLDQFLTLTSLSNITSKIIITKISLLKDEQLKELKTKLKYYEEIGYEVYFVDSLKGTNIDSLKGVFSNKVSVLSGQTGAGKSTLLNALIPGFKLKTQEISKALNRGKHTTRHTEMYQFLGGFVADTPGFSKLDFSLIKKEEFKFLFKEFDNGNCKYRKCNHISEDGCDIIKKVENGEILESRYLSYKKFFNDTKEIKIKY